jgi:HAD superfamily hydrolase (TIGR01509 family)
MYEQRVRDFFNDTTIEFIDGFQHFHNHLKTNNIPTCLATDSPNLALDILKPKLNLASFFGPHIYNSCAVGNKFKPDPAVFLHSLEKLELKPDDCIIFEDSREGVAAAKGAGVFCIGINSHNNLDELINADHIINDYNDLTLEKLSSLALLKKSVKSNTKSPAITIIDM